MISDSQAFPVSHYTTSFTLEEGTAAAQVMVMGPDDLIVSVVRYAMLLIKLLLHIVCSVKSGWQ